MEYLNLVPYDQCTGCGMCVNICPKDAINIQEDEEGYLYPHIDKDKCVSCGLCEKYCTVKQDTKSGSKPIGAYSFFLNDLAKLKESASGGIVTALAEAILANGGLVYACTYLEGYYDAGFSVCESINDFAKYKSSIYFNTQPMEQKSIKRIVDSGKLCMAVGLPCQIAALRNYVGENENLLCVSLICGGQEPRSLHRKVLDEVLQAHPNQEISHVNYRFKKKDWNTSCLKVDFKSGDQNLGGGAFRMAVLRKCCYKCNYKIDNSFADIVVGDFWGSEKLGKKFHNKYGTSVAVVLSQNGKLWIEKTATIGTLCEVSIQASYATNSAVVSSKKKNPQREKILALMKDKSLLETQKAVLGIKGYYLTKLKYKIKALLPDAGVRLAKRIKNRKV